MRYELEKVIPRSSNGVSKDRQSVYGRSSILQNIGCYMCTVKNLLPLSSVPGEARGAEEMNELIIWIFVMFCIALFGGFLWKSRKKK